MTSLSPALNASRRLSPPPLNAAADLAPPGACEGLRETLRRALLPWSLDDELLDAWASLGQERRVLTDEVLVSSQCQADRLWLLLDGVVRVGRYDRQGGWRQSRLLEAGRWIDVSSAWLGGMYLEDVLASQPARACCFDVADLLALSSRPGGGRQALASTLLALQSRELVRWMDQGQQRVLHDATARAAAWLVEQQEQQGLRIQLRERKKYIASQWGVAPETFSRVMRQLESLGLIRMQGYEVEVLEPAQLARLAG